jgi:hypothetical protein
MPLQALPEELLDGFREGRVQLFVGAGASVAAGLPSWADLMKSMCAALRAEDRSVAGGELERFLETGDFLDVAEVYLSTVGEFQYFRFLRQQFRREVKLAPIHSVLSSLPLRTIYTTNYDKLLEAAFRAKNVLDPSVVVYPQQLGYIAEDELRIIKLHGDIDHPPTIVLTRSDYNRYADRHRDFVRQLESSINERSMLFVGFGLQDPNFRRIYTDARTLYDSTKRRAFAIMIGTNEVERGLWVREGLQILPVPSPPAVVKLIKRIHSDLDGGTK